MIQLKCLTMLLVRSGLEGGGGGGSGCSVSVGVDDEGLLEDTRETDEPTFIFQFISFDSFERGKFVLKIKNQLHRNK